MLKIRAGACSVEASNPRHEHEWKLWLEKYYREKDPPTFRMHHPGISRQRAEAQIYSTICPARQS
jgi:hypothetical protein